MKFKVEAKKIKESIRLIEDVIKRSPEAQSTVEILMIADDRGLSLEAICGDVYVRNVIEAEVLDEGMVAVDSQYIRNLRFSAAHATFDLRNTSLTMRCGKFSASLETLPTGEEIAEARPGKPTDINGSAVLRSDVLTHAVHCIVLAPFYKGWLPLRVRIEPGDDGGHIISSVTADELRSATYQGVVELVKGDEIEILASSAYLINMLTKFTGNVMVTTTPHILVLRNKDKSLEIRVPMLTEEDAFLPDPYALAAKLKDQPKHMHVAVATDDFLKAIHQLKSLVTSTKSSPVIVLSQKKKELVLGIDTSIGKGKVKIDAVKFKEESTGSPKIPMVFIQEIFSLLPLDSLPKLSVWDGVALIRYKDQNDQKFLYVTVTAQ